MAMWRHLVRKINKILIKINLILDNTGIIKKKQYYHNSFIITNVKSSLCVILTFATFIVFRDVIKKMKKKNVSIRARL